LWSNLQQSEKTSFPDRIVMPFTGCGFPIITENKGFLRNRAGLIPSKCIPPLSHEKLSSADPTRLTVHRNDYPAFSRSTSVLTLKISFTISLLTCFLAASSALSNAAEGVWSERHSEYQTSTRQEKTAGKIETEMSGPLFAVISIADQRMSVYGADGLAARVPVSTGMRGHPTPTGVFSIVQKKRFHRSNIYSGAPMPYMQRITWSGIALHAGALPGYPASHGCIRLPSSFAPRLFGATEIGQRVLIAPRDTVPVEIVHKTLPAPAMQPAPAGVEVSASGVETVTAAIDAPQSPSGGTLETVSISDAPADTRVLNPLEFARLMKRDATEKARTSARETRAAMMQTVARMSELRIAGRKLASAENALEDAEDRIAAAARKLDRAEAEAASSKTADVRKAEANEADAKAAEAKAVEARAVAEAKAVEAKAAEAKAVEAKAAEARALEAKTAQETPVEAKAAETQPAEANAAEPKPENATADAKPAEPNAIEAKAAEAKAADEDLARLRTAAKQAQKAADDAERAAETAAKAAAKAEKAAAEARSDAADAQKSAEARSLRLQEAIAKAAEAKTAAEAGLGEARKVVEEARATRDAKQQEADSARRAADAAKSAGREAAQMLADANRRMKPLSVFISRKTGRLYVRQDFRPLFDAPVTIRDGERPIGTHLFVSTATAADGTTLKWSAVTMPFLEPEPKPARDRKRDRSAEEATAAAPAPQPAPETAAGALDRIVIPEDTARRLAELAWVGAAVIVSDNGISGETGETTDFIILTRTRASAPQ
jgi:hypothetical protein